MSGRFLTAPLFCSALLMVRCGPGLARIWPAAAVCAVAIGFFAPHPTVLAGRAYGDGFEGLIDTHGIADERGCYFPHAGLFSATGQRVVDHHFAQRGIRIREAGRFVVQEGNIGYTGYYAGPKAHLVNGFALTDPLLARLPVRGPNWRIGHFVRDLPHGYVETLRTGENRLRDGSIARYHDILSLVVRGELWDAGRLAAILRLNIGAHDHLTRDRFEACREHMAGSHLAYDGDWKAARAALTRAVELDSMRSAAWYLLSFAHRSSGDLDLAWRAIARSHALRPGDKGIGAAHLKVGDLYLEQGKTSEAASVYLGAARREPSDTRAWLRLGASLRKLERWREAADALAVAMALDSTRTGVWTDLAEARRLAGDLQGAAQAALSGLSRGSTDIRVWSEYLTIGSTYHSGGEVDSALAIYEAVVASAPELTDVHVNLGILHFGEGRYEASAASFEKAIARSPDDAGGHMGLAEALEQLGRTEEAVASYRRGLSIEPDNEAARAGLRRLTGLE